LIAAWIAPPRTKTEGGLEYLEPRRQPRGLPTSAHLYNVFKCDHSRTPRFLPESRDRINKVVL